ncbi:MAG: hypothetical protein LBQ20_06585 [Rhodanobacter sp.]|jgi:hypothetical protein|nr:hypothetical protein [Rhodanobacter sp.]
MYKQIGVIVVLLLGMSGCGKSTPESAGASSQPVIAGEVTQASYDNAVKEILAHAIVLMNSATPTEPELDGDIGKIEALLALSEKNDVDKERTYEAPLMSTLGTLYARKAANNSTDPRIAGALIAKSYRYLDKAISLHPQDLMAKVNRGLVSAKAPDFLGKAEIAHEDLKSVEDDADFGRLSPDLQTAVKQALAEVDSRLAKSGNGK